MDRATAPGLVLHTANHRRVISHMVVVMAISKSRMKPDHGGNIARPASPGQIQRNRIASSNVM